MTTATWNRYWRRDAGGVDRLALAVFREMERSFSFPGASVLELGCGAGRLSCLALRAGARRAVLADSSSEALARSRSLLAGDGRAEFLETEIRSLDLAERFDLVFSSGVVEHFREEEAVEVLAVHRRHARGTVLVVVPASPHYNNLRMRRAATVRDFGWQRPISPGRMAAFFERAGIAVARNYRFYPFYAVGRLHSSRIWNLLFRPLERCCGGLLLTAGSPRGRPNDPELRPRSTPGSG